MNKKYLYLTVLLVLFSLVTTGCFRVHTNVKLNKDGSGTWNYIVAISEDLYNMQEMQGNSEDPMEEIRQEAAAEGFRVEDYNQDSFRGVSLSKDFANVEEISGQNFLAGLNEEDQSIDADQFEDVFQPNIKVEEGFFYTSYIVATEADLSMPEGTMGEGDDFSQEMDQFSQMFLSMMDIQFTIDLPAPAGAHNATTVSNNGKSLSWQLKMNENNEISVEMKVLNTTNIIIIAAIGLILLAIVFIIINNKKRGYVEYTKE
ncbi:MAG: LppM family (lipo)protein [Halanaerobiales bacterium]